MKKQLLIIAVLMGAALTATAQLKVNSLGNVTIDTQPTDTSACLFVKSFRPTPNGFGNHPSGEQYGVRSQTTGKSKYNMAVYGDATYNTSVPSFTNNTCYNYGVFGLAGNSNVNIGVFGSLSTGNGAAVLGSIYSSLPAISGRYAGYFSGDVYVSKTVSAKLINSSDWIYLSDSDPMPSVLDDLADIYVRRFYNSPVLPPLNGNGDDPDLRLVPQLNGEHYLLDASSVEDVFPCLVGTNDQNNSYVNYTELIPVLVKAIQELKAELDDVRGTDNTMQMAPQKEMTSENSAISRTSNLKTQTTKLYQNHPNPFSERTEIRFSLPDDAQNAYIYIFDMQGKMLRQIPVDASMQSVIINGYELSAGIYLYSLAVNGQEVDTKRMILSK